MLYSRIGASPNKTPNTAKFLDNVGGDPDMSAASISSALPLHPGSSNLGLPCSLGRNSFQNAHGVNRGPFPVPVSSALNM